MHRAALLVLLAVAPACVRVNSTMSPREIRDHLPALRAQGEATVALQPEGTYRLRLDDKVRARFRTTDAATTTSTPGSQREVLLTVAELIAHCPERGQDVADDPTGPCLLTQTTSPHWVIRSRVRPDGRAIRSAVLTTVWLGAVGGFLGCLAACDSKGAQGASAAGLGAMLFAPLLFVTWQNAWH